MDGNEEPMLYLIHQSNGYVRIGDENNWTVCHEVTGDSARLIAAAPSLLNALKVCRSRLAEWVDSGSADDADFEAVKLADAAIASTEWRME